MKIALVGNQNSGKTTLFNLLTGTNQKVGNWPGVTIERKEGKIKGSDDTLVDLPGIYSLSPYTAEEEVSRQFVINETPDLIINIVDATCIERSLYLTTQLLELDTDVIIALNMCDALEKKGITIDENKMGEILNASVVKISALKGMGIDTLINIIKEKKIKKNLHQKIFPTDIEKLIDDVKIGSIHKRFITIKMLENDPKYVELLTTKIKSEINDIEEKYGTEMEQIIANERYNFITALKKQCVIEKERNESVTDKIDKVILNKWAAIPIFVVIMALVYYLAVGKIGNLTVDLISNGVSIFQTWLYDKLLSINASPWSASLVCDGIVAGVGAVLGFLPQLIILFICIAILETSGYMSRIAFFLDRIFHNFGLSGKSLIPFIVGSGCSVPGIMTARTIEDDTEKRITIMCTPFIPCSAKLPIIALFAGYFFKDHSGLITVSLYFLAIFVILLSSFIMKKFFFKKSHSAFISELPEYKFPSIKYVARDVCDKSIAFIKRAGTIILLCSVIIWFLSKFNWRFEMLDGTRINESILASIGNVFAFAFYPMTGKWSWELAVSSIQGLVAKEQVVASMKVIAGLSDAAKDGAMFESGAAFSFLTPLSAYAYCVFNLFSAPCIGAIGAMRRELGSRKRMWQAILFQTGLAWVLSCSIYGIGRLIMLIVGV